MNNKAFTLIEILVAVLIIGILAAIAVPQYRLAVQRSTYAKVRLALQDISRAQQLFYLNNGRYANPSEEDKIDAPYQVKNNHFIIDSQITCQLGNSGGPYISCLVNNAIIQHWFTESPMGLQCLSYASYNNFAGDKFCQFITNKKEANPSSNSVVHSYSGNLTHL